MNKIINYLVANADKLLHFIACLVIVIIAAKCCSLLQGHLSLWGLFVAIGLTLYVGIAKEVLDWLADETFSLGDIVADVCGIVAGVLLLLFILI